MSYNGSGTFVINSAGQPVVTGTVISSTAFNALTADLATGLSTAITKDGQTTTTSRILFAQGISSTLVTDATSTTTGSIITAGGISCQKAAVVGTLLGVGMAPSNVLDITKNAAGAQYVNILNSNAGTSASAGYHASNGTSTFQLDQLGATYTTSGVFRQNGTLLYGDGAGGLTIDTGAAQPIYFGINNTEAARIDSSGRLLVGTTTAEGYLTVVKASPTNGRIAVFSNGVDANVIFPLSTSLSGIGSGTTTPFLFYSDGSERARFDTSGRFQFGTTTNVGSASFGVTMFPNGSIQVSQNTTGAAAVLAFYNPNGAVGTIQTSGSSTSYVTSSDYRLKENVQPMTGGLATVAALKPVNYDWIIDKSAGEGFIAHELQAVIPAAVTGEKDAVDDKGEIKPQGVDFSKIVPHLVAAIQELTTRLAALENK